ncbi:melanoma-associated antigen B1-like [Peromyscus maniculatus bairdii]|uniref:melanoma-associated antigen B1-like n=1 Tax=Peromyscus maniculatus bairdii TaxID=230844 RepID=UPI001C2F07D1|nr:melanoma-associated antigen B1-like [Peromyscus maniculatus bairdii]XP_042118330.1 melanoma-associated antigen B1-like [Peromyscus maniculatus bairdii]
MPYFPHFSLEKVFQDAFEIHRLAEEEEEMEEKEEVEKEEEGEEEEEEGEEEEVEEGEEVDEEEEEEEEEEGWEVTNIDTISSTLSASLKIILPPSCPSPPSTLSSCPLFWGSPDGTEGSVSWMLSISQSCQSSYSFISCSNLDEESGILEEERLTILKLTDDDAEWQKLKKQKVSQLVNLLILKYRMKECIEEVEKLRVVTEDHRKQFPVIFKEASKCLEMIFGIDMKENDPVSRSYVLTNTLNLTYDDSNWRLPRNGFLIITLGVIFIEGNCASEESVWEFLNVVGIYDGKEHFIYGEHREFLTRDLVQQNYLRYRQVPDSYHPHYVFLWGPRAYSETTKMKVLEFLTKFTRRDPIYFSSLYSEALGDEEERAQARKGPMD